MPLWVWPCRIIDGATDVVGRATPISSAGLRIDLDHNRQP
jgi:hypothetical protein